MSRKNNLYVGKAGQFHVMSEFLIRGWNVAVPEVDVGDDIFVVRDSNGDFSRIQVKTANGVERQNGYSAQFSIPLHQLLVPSTPRLTYVLVVRLSNTWENMLIIERDQLFVEYDAFNVGTVSGKNLILHISYQDDKIICSNRDWTAFKDNLEAWEIIPN